MIFGDAFIPGDFENIVHRTGNKRTDLQDYLSKILRKEKFYRVKTDYLAKGPQRLEKPGSRRKDMAGSASSFTQQDGGILINININKVYVYHKSLREIEEFFTALTKRIDANPVIDHLIKEILSRDSIKKSAEQSSASIDQGYHSPIKGEG